MPRLAHEHTDNQQCRRNPDGLFIIGEKKKTNPQALRIRDTWILEATTGEGKKMGEQLSEWP